MMFYFWRALTGLFVALSYTVQVIPALHEWTRGDLSLFTIGLWGCAILCMVAAYLRDLRGFFVAWGFKDIEESMNRIINEAESDSPKQ